jgi:hypothetical protein
MRHFWKFLKAHYRGYDFLPDYIRSIKYAGWDVIWAPLLPSLLYWLLWFRPNPPSWWITLFYAVWVVIVAGYFLWRPNHIRLIPKLGVGEVSMVYTGTGVPDHKRRYVQVLIKCETEAPIENCRGQLRRISKWTHDSDGNDGKWETTHINETLDLLWSFVDEPTLTLEHGAPRRLNIFFVENTSRNMVIWTRMRVGLASAPSDRFKFDIRVAGDECTPKYFSVEVAIGDQWNELTDLHLETTAHV